MSIYDEKYLWEVPREDAAGPGILLSDRIAFYADLVKMIDPFDPECLRPASCDLTVGDSYYFENRLEKIGPDGTVRIPPNAVVYIKIKERFNLPYYIVARYSLRVSQVYRGLFVDNGLQVDPGYHGQIHAVVHNLMNQERIVKQDERFMSVEFTRTSPFSPPGLSAIQTEKQLVSKQPFRGLAGRPLVVFTTKPDDLGVSREPSFFKRHGEVNSPATYVMLDRLDKLEAAKAHLEEAMKEDAERLKASLNEETAQLKETRSRGEEAHN